MYSHNKTHSSDKPYSCDVCDKTFKRSQHLKDHKRIHTGEKPYHCDLCNTSFTRISHLHRHKKTGDHIKKVESHNSSFESQAGDNDDVLYCEPDIKQEKTF